MQELRGKVAVVTGAASGIGRAMATRFADEGMKVVLADVEAGPLEEAAAELTSGGAEAVAVRTDVADQASVDALSRAALDAFSAVHVLCNNAGVFSAGVSWESSLEDYEWVMGVNTWGVVHGIRSFVPIMLEQGGEAHIVNTSSMAGLTSMPFCSIYHMSKHAVVALSECLYHELQMKGGNIHVSVLCPEGVATRINAAGRNRPESFGPAGASTPEAELAQEAIDSLVDVGLAPSVMADRVVSAIREDRFYILAEDGWRDACNSRLDDIRAGRNPTLTVPGG